MRKVESQEMIKPFREGARKCPYSVSEWARHRTLGIPVIPSRIRLLMYFGLLSLTAVCHAPLGTNRRVVEMDGKARREQQTDYLCVNKGILQGNDPNSYQILCYRERRAVERGNYILNGRHEVIFFRVSKSKENGPRKYWSDHL